MRRAAAAGLALLLAAAPGASTDADAADVRATIAAFAQRLTVRMGVAQGSLVVLPLVLEDDPPAAAPLSAAAAGATWQRLQESVLLVDVTSGDADAASPRFLPSATLLLGGDRELVTLRPSPLVGPERARLATAPCDSRRKPAEPSDRRTVGRMAPVEQRKLLLVGRHDDSFALLQRVQALIAGVPATAETVNEVLDSQYCGDVERAYWTQLAKIPKAYGGRTVGHIAFFGYRPVEVVAFARPADYQSFGPAYLRSLAVSHAFWAELLGAAGAQSAEPEIRRLVGEGTAVVAGLARVNPRSDPGVHGEESRWKLFAAAAQSDVRPGGHTEDFQCRFALDATGAVVHVEAAETGSDLVFPPPYTEPGGRPVGEPPSNKGGGMGPQALQRILDRLLERRSGR